MAWHGVYDTQQFWIATLQAKDLSQDLILAGLQRAPFDAASSSPTNYGLAVMFSRCWAHVMKYTEVWVPTTRAACEMLGPYIPANHKLAPQAAVTRFVEVMTGLLPISVQIPGSTAASITASYREAVCDTTANFTTFVTSLDSHTFVGASGYDEALAYLRLLYHIRRMNGEVESLRGLITICVAMAKRGTVTTGYITKIERGIQDDLGRTISLVLDEIQGFWRNACQFLDETNIQRVLTDWTNKIPNQALRLSLTLQQIPGEGLTSIITIHKALTAYPDFQWNILEAMFPMETTTIIQALQLVSGNAYYGYKKDLGIVKSTGYKNIAYVAKELVVKIGGDAQLSRAACFTRRPAQQADLDTMVALYEQNNPRGYQAILARHPAPLGTLTAACNGIQNFYG